MNKNILIIIGVVVAVMIFGGIAYSMQMKSQSNISSDQSSKDNISQELTQQESDPEIQENSMDFSGNIFDLLNKNQSLQCTFEGDMDGTMIKGATLISGNKMRGEFNMEFEGQEISTNLISDGEYLYTWTPSLKSGMKMKIDEASKEIDSESKVTEEEINQAREDFQQNYDYKCGNWNVDDTVFEIPSDVNFTDYSTMIDNLKQNSQNLCASCDMIQDPTGKAQCKEQLNCP